MPNLPRWAGGLLGSAAISFAIDPMSSSSACALHFGKRALNGQLSHESCGIAWHNWPVGASEPLRQNEFREQRGVEKRHDSSHPVGPQIQHVQLKRHVAV